jgi:hypothetical protein
MWDVQRQEHFDHEMGCATEQQNAFAWASMNRRGDDPRINEALAAGKHVIVESGPEYCPYTDALMGSRKILVSVHETREAAEAALRGYQAEHEDPDPEIDVFILPYKAVEYRYPTDDEIPF